MLSFQSRWMWMHRTASVWSILFLVSICSISHSSPTYCGDFLLYPKIETPHLDRLIQYVGTRSTIPSLKQLADLRNLDDFIDGEIAFQPKNRISVFQTGTFTVNNSLPVDFSFARQFIPELKFEHFLEQLEIPSRLVKYFDPKTGELNLRVFNRFNLAPENGDVPLSALRINLPKYLFDPRIPRYLTRLKTFLDDIYKILQINSELEIWIVANKNPQAQSFLDTKLKEFSRDKKRRVKIIEVAEEVNLNVWSQDGSKPLADTHATLTKPYENRVEMDYISSTKALRNIGIEAKSGDLYFEGGNVIVSSRHVFIGTDIVSEIMFVFGISRNEALKALETEFNSSVVEIGIPQFLEGDLKQIDFHIDLSMAVVRNKTSNRETAIIQSPVKLFEEILGVSNVMDISAPEFDSLVLGYLRSIKEQIDKRARRNLSNNEQQFLTEVSNTSFYRLLKREKMFRVLAKQMKDLGYDVERVPGLTRVGQNNSVSRIFNYTNIVVDMEHIIAPQLGIPQLDNMAYETFRGLGYTVIPMSSAPQFLIDGGGIRCACETFRKIPSNTKD